MRVELPVLFVVMDSERALAGALLQDNDASATPRSMHLFKLRSPQQLLALYEHSSKLPTNCRPWLTFSC
jgi:hypothetical protein